MSGGCKLPIDNVPSHLYDHPFMQPCPFLYSMHNPSLPVPSPVHMPSPMTGPVRPSPAMSPLSRASGQRQENDSAKCSFYLNLKIRFSALRVSEEVRDFQPYPDCCPSHNPVLLLFLSSTPDPGPPKTVTMAQRQSRYSLRSGTQVPPAFSSSASPLSEVDEGDPPTRTPPNSCEYEWRSGRSPLSPSTPTRASVSPARPQHLFFNPPPIAPPAPPKQTTSN